jgi:hypothetical protein
MALTLSLDPDVFTLMTGTPLDLSITTVRSVPRLPTGTNEKGKVQSNVQLRKRSKHCAKAIWFVLPDGKATAH